MKNTKAINVMILGASCFDGMASSMRVRNLIEPLNKSGVININNLIYEKDSEIEIQKKGRINNINYAIIGFKFKSVISIIRFLYQGLKFIKTNKLPNQKNIIYNFSYPDIQNIAFILFGKFMGYKIIFDIIEDNKTFSYYPTIRGRLRIYSSILFVKLIPFIADSIIVISDHLNKNMTALTRKIPVELIPITVNFDYFKSFPRALDLSNLKIFYGGSFMEKDGIEYLIDAFEQIHSKYKNIRLILTGRGMDDDIKRIEILIGKSTAKENISYMGYLETDEYYKLMNESDIFCMTRINSKFSNAGFPFKLGEFLATGKAVIATNVGDVSKYLTHNINALIIEPNSVEQLANSISLLVENPEIRLTIGIEGRKTAQYYFDTDKVSQKLFSVFQSTFQTQD